jgi:hypothetical protein
MHSNGHRVLQTFDEVVEELGGKHEVARICADQEMEAVCNWRSRRKRFPTKYYKVMIEELNARGATAPDGLWGFYEREKC